MASPPLARPFRRLFRSSSSLSSLLLAATLLMVATTTTTMLLGRTKEATGLNNYVEVVDAGNNTSLTCDSSTLVLSSTLDSRRPWPDDPDCAHYRTGHLVPHCRPPVALASYPGSGNTWIRYLLEGAGGVFTGSRYKDLQLQMFGFWGEIRDWRDGTTAAQKTHDASPGHVAGDFGGRAILVVRNPYAAILSTHNFLYAGHHGRAPADNFKRADWEHFVTIQMSKWLDMATNWTIHSSPDKVIVLHYEEVRRDPASQMRRALAHLNIPADERRIDHCLMRHLNGYFQRRAASSEPESVAFPAEMRSHLDVLIDATSASLDNLGFGTLPTGLYEYYRRTDQQILEEIREKNKRRKEEVGKQVEQESSGLKLDKSHGAKMVLKNYFKWLDSEDKRALQTGVDTNEDLKTQLMRQLFNSFRQVSPEKTTTGLSEKAEGLLEKAVEIWPIVSKPFQRDKIEESISNDGNRGATVKELLEKYF